MALIWVLYAVLNITVFGLVVLFARASRARATPNERLDLEDNSIIAEEWVLILREQCLPARCPRVVGNPPRPRRDVTCEICAALFMERYWQDRLSGVPSAEPSASWRAPCEPGMAPTGLREPGLRSLDGGFVPGGWRRERNERLPRRSTRVRWICVTGFACVLTGAVLGALTSLLIPGYLLVLTGIALLVAGAITGSV